MPDKGSKTPEPDERAKPHPPGPPKPPPGPHKPPKPPHDRPVGGNDSRVDVSSSWKH